MGGEGGEQGLGYIVRRRGALLTDDGRELLLRADTTLSELPFLACIVVSAAPLTATIRADLMSLSGFFGAANCSRRVESPGCLKMCGVRGLG